MTDSTFLYQPRDGDTTPIDYSATPVAFGADSGTVMHSDAGIWPGYGSTHFPSSGYHTFTPDADFDMSGNYVLDLIFEITAYPSVNSSLNLPVFGDATNHFVVEFVESYSPYSGARVYIRKAGVLSVPLTQFASVQTLSALGWALNTLYNVRIVRSSGTLSFYRNGSRLMQATGGDAGSLLGRSSITRLGAFGVGGVRLYACRLECGTDGGYGTGATTPVPTGPWLA